MTIVPNSRGLESEGFLYRATVLRKILAYAESWKRSLHKTHFGIPTVRVLFLTTTDKRATAMRITAMNHIVSRKVGPTGIVLFGLLGDAMSVLRTDVDWAGGC